MGAPAILRTTAVAASEVVNPYATRSEAGRTERDSRAVGVLGPDFLAAADIHTVTTRDTASALLAHEVIGVVAVPIIHRLRHPVTPQFPSLESASSLPVYTTVLFQRAGRHIDIAAYGVDTDQTVKRTTLTSRPRLRRGRFGRLAYVAFGSWNPITTISRTSTIGSMNSSIRRVPENTGRFFDR